MRTGKVGWMRNRTSIVLLLASVLLVTGSLVGCGTPSESDTFPDENLEVAIRDASVSHWVRK